MTRPALRAEDPRVQASAVPALPPGSTTARDQRWVALWRRRGVPDHWHSVPRAGGGGPALYATSEEAREAGLRHGCSVVLGEAEGETA